MARFAETYRAARRNSWREQRVWNWERFKQSPPDPKKKTNKKRAKQ
jgi:hypothetical protein